MKTIENRIVMRIELKRYYGDERVTKSTLRIEESNFECEARETAFRDYSEKFAGCSNYCLPTGTFACKTVPTEISPLTVTVMKAAGHRSCRFVYQPLKQTKTNSVVLGQSDGNDDLTKRQIVKSQETFEQFESLIRQAFIDGDEILIDVKNEIADQNI